MMLLNKIGGKWFLSRVLILIILVGVVLTRFVDFKEIGYRYKVRRLNDSKPNFHYLVLNVLDKEPVPERMWKNYDQYFQLVLKYIPDDPVAQGLLGFVKAKNQKIEEAINLWKASSSGAPYYFWSDYNLGLYYYKKGDFKKAVTHLEKAIDVPPKVIVQVMVGSVMYRQILQANSFDISLANRVKSAYHDALIVFLANLEKLGLYDVMLKMALRFINDPDHQQADLYYFAGMALFHLQQLDKAAAMYSKAIELDKKAPWSYFWLSKVLEMMQNPDAAANYWKAFTILKQETKDDVYDQRPTYRVF